MVKIITEKGEQGKNVKLPDVFKEEYRPDLIKKAVIYHQAKRRQRYGADSKAGLKTSAHYEGSRHVAPSTQMMNREMSRMPREHGDTSRRFRAMLAPHAVGGRRAHPPKAEKNWEKKINKKERRKAVRSALAATAKEKFVKERNHRFDGKLPLVAEDGIQKIKKTEKLENFLKSAGLEEEIKRGKAKKVRAGKGKNRGRKYKRKKSLLIVIDEDKGIGKAARNIPGVDVSTVESLNAELLSPGAHGARLTLYTESALKKIDERWFR